jgi:DNA mismatch repair protein MSH5
MQSESHPHAHNQGPTKGTSGSKEALSVYGLFHRLARTPQGKCLLRQYFFRPSLDIQVINERLNTVAVFLRPENWDIISQLGQCLRKIRNMRSIIIRLRKGISSTSSGGKGLGRRIWSNVLEVSSNEKLNLDPTKCGTQFVFHVLKIMDLFRQMERADHLLVYKKVGA